MPSKGYKQTTEHTSKILQARGKKQFCRRGHNTLVVGRYKNTGSCLECRKQNDSKWQTAHPETVIESRLQARYGITLATKQTMLSSQHNQCSICQSPIDLRTGQVDHDHATGRIRDLLCWSCNVGLGKFDDNFELLQKAAQYLLDHHYCEQAT